MCHFTEQRGACTGRAARAESVASICGHAYQRVSELERAARAAAHGDLFNPPPQPEEVAFWWGVHRACGLEYRRLARLFWMRCAHND